MCRPYEFFGFSSQAEFNRKRVQQNVFMFCLCSFMKQQHRLGIIITQTKYFTAKTIQFLLASRLKTTSQKTVAARN